VLVGALLVGLGFGARTLILRLRARSPRVQITPFSWAAGEGDRESLWVTSLFREQLKALQLDGLDPVPDRAPGAPLVEIVEGVGQGLGKGLEWGKILGRLWRAVVPDCAYEVWGTLQPRGEGSGSISIQLISRVGGNRTLVNFTSEAAEWDNCARGAAMAAAGALYPHLANRHKGPWVEWKQPVPPDLLGLYQGALEYEQNHQFEQALCGFRETVEKDPLNPQLRLKVAMIEERLGLQLGAWFTYWAIVAESDRRMWKGAHRRTRLVALYRLAIHLWNPKLAKEWIRTEKGDGDALRREKLERLRTELRCALEREDVFKGEGTARGVAATATATELMGALAGGSASREGLMGPFEEGMRSADRTERIAEVLQIVSLDRLEELRERMCRRRLRSGSRWPDRRCRRRPLRRWLFRVELPPLAVDASEVLIRVHLARSIAARLRAGGGETYDTVKQSHLELLKRWPFPDWDDRPWVTTLGRRARVWLGDRRGDAWQLHYNAACAIATQLSRNAIRSDRTEVKAARWVKAAIEQLESFSYYARSARIAAMADWIAFEDPDLDDLYPYAEFKLWGSQRFGFGLPENRPSRVGVERHTILILKRSAAAFAASWRSRAVTPGVAPSSLLDWWTEELEIWERLGRICRGQQSWRHRLDGFNALERWNAANELKVEFTREKREHQIGCEPFSHGCLEGLVTLMESADDGKEALLTWVKGRTGEVTISCGRLGAAPASASAVLPRTERKAALEAATIWSDIEAVLGKALRSSEDPAWEEIGKIGTEA
jgi:hypothetical protein